MAAGQVWHDALSLLVLPGGLLFAAGTVVFAVVVWRVPLSFPLRINPQPLFFLAASAWLVVTALLSFWSFTVADYGVVPLDYSGAVIETFLRGFVMFAIVAVGLRAFVGHLDLRPLSARRQLIVFAALNASLVVWLAGQGLGSPPRVDFLVRLGDVGYGATLLLLTAWLGVLKRLRPRRGGAIYELLVPVAWVGVVTYAAALLFAAVFVGDNSMNAYREGAIRHIFLLGFMIPLMVAMAHVVLARFGTGFVPWERALTAAFVLIVVAWPLRVVPVLINDSPGDISRGLLAAAGFLVMAGLALVALVCARTAFLMKTSPAHR
jgi:hypothetical protein